MHIPPGPMGEARAWLTPPESAVGTTQRSNDELGWRCGAIWRCWVLDRLADGLREGYHEAFRRVVLGFVGAKWYLSRLIADGTIVSSGATVGVRQTGKLHLERLGGLFLL